MSGQDEETLRLSEGRFARFDAIEWWEQRRLREARVLVVGAGALGNEVVKNLALLGVGRLAVVDMDRIERSNLSRSVLFRERDEGSFKADCAVRAARDIYPEIRAQALVGNVLTDVGWGWFRWADVVVGALDNREARVLVNRACAATGRAWFDGGIEVLNGIVRGFAPPETACYQCTMSATDWEQLDLRRSCAFLARRAVSQRGTPTTPTTASIIAAIQCQEVVKHLHGRATLLGRGFFFEGANHSSYAMEYPVKADCELHEPAATIQPAPDLHSGSPMGAFRERAEAVLGEVDALDLEREVVEALECPACGAKTETLRQVETLTEEDARCGACGEMSVPHFLHSLAPDSPRLGATPAELGLPPWDVIWARRGERIVGIEATGDAPWPGSPDRAKGTDR